MEMNEQGMNKFILGIIIVGIVLVIGIFISAQFQDTLRVSSTAGSYVNTTMAKPTVAGITLEASTLLDGQCGAITTMYNGTGGVRIGLGNITQTGCVVKNATVLTNYTANWLVSYPYTYTADTSASNASGDLVTALSGGTAWITILVVVGFAVMVLGFLMSGLGKATETTGPTY